MIKDWAYAVPPVSGYEKVYDNRITGERLFIAKNKTKITPSQKNFKYSYTIFIDGESNKTFKTKSQALSFANKYMRNN